jgi:DNA-binding NarL/FixJ family response regulator
MIKVLLADDHPLVRKGIRSILHRSPDIRVIGEAGDGHQALRLVEELKPDVLVLDMEMPLLKGIDVAKKLKADGSHLPILALSAHEDKHFILGMLNNGASGYLVKDEVPETIVRAVKGVASGEAGWVSRRIAARIAVWLNSEQSDGKGLDLNDEDIRILRLFIAGKSSWEISAALGKEVEEVNAKIQQIVLLVRESLEK